MKFEDLTMVYREEKTKGLLSNARSDLYPAMTALLATLKSEYEKLLSEDPDSIMCEGANQRRRKAGRLVRDIVSLRMDKISSMALRAACGAQTVIDVLTAEEREFYDSVLNAAKIHMGSVDRATGQVRYKIQPITKTPEPVKSAPPEEEPMTLKDMPLIDDMEDFDSDVIPEEDVFDSFEESPVEERSLPEMPAIKETKEEKEEIISSPETKTAECGDSYEDESVLIRVLEDLPVFAGPDRDYNLKKEELVTMPRSMAGALISREKAVLIRPAL